MNNEQGIRQGIGGADISLMPVIPVNAIELLLLDFVLPYSTQSRRVKNGMAVHIL